jgi:putative endonuclease
MPSAKQKFGSLAERAAEDFLRGHGFTILDTHVTSRYGEIDILAQDGETLVAVEVKIRRTKRFGTAVESMTQQKLEKLAAALQTEAERRSGDPGNIRIDLLALDPGRASGQFTVTFIQSIS